MTCVFCRNGLRRRPGHSAGLEGLRLRLLGNQHRGAGRPAARCSRCQRGGSGGFETILSLPGLVLTPIWGRGRRDYFSSVRQMKCWIGPWREDELDRPEKCQILIYWLTIYHNGNYVSNPWLREMKLFYTVLRHLIKCSLVKHPQGHSDHGPWALSTRWHQSCTNAIFFCNRIYYERLW